MGNWLSGQTSNLCTQVNGMASILDNMKKDFVESNDTYYSTAQNLTDPKNQTFQGKGAQAFLLAVDADINKLRPLVDGLGHMSSACSDLTFSITNSGTVYDGKIAAIPYDARVPHNTFEKWRDALISNLFEDIYAGPMSDPLSEILQNGSDFTIGSWSSALRTVESMAATDAMHWIATHPTPEPVPEPTLNNSSSTSNNDSANQAAQQLQNDYMNALHDLASDILTYVKNWADDLRNAYKTFQSAIQNPDGYLSPRDIYDLLYYGSLDGSYTDGTQSTNSPITITPYTTKDGKTGLLVTIGGTDMGHLTNDDSILAALNTGEGLPTAYQVEIHNALETYLSEHPEMKGSELTLAGYSLGGMQAQLFADNLVNGKYPDLDLHVTNVITYGSPVMGPPANGINYTMYDAVDDPVPLLSYYENPQLTKLQGTLAKLGTDPAGAIQQLMNQGGDAYNAYLSLIHADQLPWQQKVDTYIDPKHQYHIIPVSDVGNNSIGTGDPSVGFSSINLPFGIQVPNPFGFHFNPGHQLNIQNHMQYYRSAQLNSSQLTTNLNIDPNSLGPTEYFPITQ